VQYYNILLSDFYLRDNIKELQCEVQNQIGWKFSKYIESQYIELN